MLVFLATTNFLLAVSGLRFTAPQAGHSVFRTSDFTLAWISNVPVDDDPEYTLGYRETTPGVYDKWHVVAQTLYTSVSQRSINGNLFPNTGQFQIGAFKEGHVGPSDNPVYLTPDFRVDP